ncbi:MAG: plastocyanin/azurin family copper-binding protein, partial [Bacteroidota bacterium]
MKRTVGLFMFSLSAVFLSCGEKKEDKEKDGFQMERKKTAEKVGVDENTIALSSNDLMQFDKSELKVMSGKPVTLTLRHTGKMDKMVMGHNFVLLKSGTDIAKFAAKAAVARESEYIPEGDETIVYTKLIGGGESVTISFDAPIPGAYDYICSFPGHYGVMKATGRPRAVYRDFGLCRNVLRDWAHKGLLPGVVKS